jgi:hypothetical protein
VCSVAARPTLPLLVLDRVGRASGLDVCVCELELALSDLSRRSRLLL